MVKKLKKCHTFRKLCSSIEKLIDILLQRLEEKTTWLAIGIATLLYLDKNLREMVYHDDKFMDQLIAFIVGYLFLIKEKK